jgi:hypothetical protein
VIFDHVADNPSSFAYSNPIVYGFEVATFFVCLILLKPGHVAYICFVSDTFVPSQVKPSASATGDGVRIIDDVGEHGTNAASRDSSAAGDGESKAPIKKMEVEDTMCPICYLPTSGVSYKQHFRTSHPGMQFKKAVYIQPRVCPHCPYRAINKWYYVRHVRKHTTGTYG